MATLSYCHRSSITHPAVAFLQSAACPSHHPAYCIRRRGSPASACNSHGVHLNSITCSPRLPSRCDGAKCNPIQRGARNLGLLHRAYINGTADLGSSSSLGHVPPIVVRPGVDATDTETSGTADSTFNGQLLSTDTPQSPNTKESDGLQPADENDTSSSDDSSSDDLDQKIRSALNFAWVMNILLLGAKLYAFYISNSKAVLASLADSVVDIISQFVILITAAICKSPDLEHYPVGRARLEAIGVLACACIMSVCAVEVIKSGLADLYQGFVLKELPCLDTSALMYGVLLVATGIKLVAYFACAQLQARSDFMVALAEDQLNDVMSNSAALIAGAVAGLGAHFWWMDAVGAIVISLYIVYRWALIAINQVDKIVGRAAPESVVRRLEQLAKAHHGQMTLSGLKAYYFGSKCMVEMEVVMPGDLPLKKVHGIAMKLQCKLESLEEVERAFVHVDYRHRPEPYHKAERQLMGLAPSWKSATA